MKDSEELLAVVDLHDKELAPLPRAVVRARGLWCRSVHVWIVNSEGHLLCHQRSLNKDSNPGRWTPHFGGHNKPGESYMQAAIRELQEETGITVKESYLEYYKTHKWDKGHKFQAIYILRWNGEASELSIDSSEVEQLAWVKPGDVRKPGDHKEWTDFGYEDEFLAFLQNKKPSLTTNPHA